MTATPKSESNIISYVDAVQLKGEHMVKLPVIVYNRDSQAEVLIDAIDLRNKLEQIAVSAQKVRKKYIVLSPCSKRSLKAKRMQPPLKNCGKGW